MLELRVLTGTHAGARVLLPDQPQQLGSASDCDLILTDEGLLAHHASIEALEDGSVLLRWLEEPGGEVVLKPGEGAELGPVRIAIDAADSPWREDVPLRGPLPLAPAQDASAEDTKSAGRGPRQAQAPGTRAPPGRLATRLGWSLAGLGFAGLGTALLMALVPWLDASRLQSADSSPASAPALPASMPPRTRVLTPSQIQARLEEALFMQEGLAGKALVAVPLEGGRFRIEGRVASAAQRDELMDLLARSAPGLPGLESGLVTDEDEAQALLRDLREQGIASSLEGEWTGGRLALRARLAPQQLARWERGLALAAAAHPVPFHVTVSAAAPPPAPSLPFALRSVVGGSMPFVTLADGRRLALDGQVEGWRLVAIRPEAVVFENAQGLRFTLER